MGLCHFAFKDPVMTNQNKKRGSKVTRRQSRRTPQISLNPVPVNNSVVTLAYAQMFVLTEPTLGTGAIYTFSLTGPYDPNITGVGLQPAGFDPMMLTYQNYRVLGTRVQISFANTLNTTAVVGCQPSNSNALPSTLASWLIDPNGFSMTLGGIGGGKGMRVFDKTYDMPNLFHVSKASYLADLDYSGSAIANPVRQMYLMLWIRGISVASVVDMVVKISYRISFFNPVLQALS